MRPGGSKAHVMTGIGEVYKHFKKLKKANPCLRNRQAADCCFKIQPLDHNRPVQSIQLALTSAARGIEQGLSDALLALGASASITWLHTNP